MHAAWTAIAGGGCSQTLSRRWFDSPFVRLRRCPLPVQSMASTHALTDSMKKITQSMVALNKATNMPELQKIMQEFSKQSEQMEMKQEMIGEALDDSVDEEDEKESDLIVSQVLDELGVSLSEGLVDVPKQKAAAAAEPVQKDEKDSALEARFNNLQGGK